MRRLVGNYTYFVTRPGAAKWRDLRFPTSGAKSAPEMGHPRLVVGFSPLQGRSRVPYPCVARVGDHSRWQYGLRMIFDQSEAQWRDLRLNPPKLKGTFEGQAFTGCGKTMALYQGTTFSRAVNCLKTRSALAAGGTVFALFPPGLLVEAPCFSRGKLDFSPAKKIVTLEMGF